jgi:hypothetical protein
MSPEDVQNRIEASVREEDEIHARVARFGPGERARGTRQKGGIASSPMLFGEVPVL